MDTHTEIMPAATWETARDLLAAAKTGAMAWRDLRAVLEELREQHTAQGAGGGRRSSAMVTSAHREPKLDKKAEAGWQAIVVDRLGISLATAKRLLADARCYRQMLAN